MVQFTNPAVAERFKAKRETDIDISITGYHGKLSNIDVATAEKLVAVKDANIELIAPPPAAKKSSNS